MHIYIHVMIVEASCSLGHPIRRSVLISMATDTARYFRQTRCWVGWTWGMCGMCVYSDAIQLTTTVW